MKPRLCLPIAKAILFLLLLFPITLIHTEAAQIPFIRSTSPSPSAAPSTSNEQSFSLTHALHLGTHRHPGLHLQRTFSHADRVAILSGEGSGGDGNNEVMDLKLKTRKTKIWRANHKRGMRSPHYEAARKLDWLNSRSSSRSCRSNISVTMTEDEKELARTLEWDQVEVEAPDVTDMETLASLAKMTSNAYNTPGDKGSWYDLDGKWNVSESFGWEEDGIRGHVFANPDNSTIVIAVKGTSAGLLGGGGSTGKNDKFNDNLMFSCCCARVDWSWTPVCDCYEGGWKCGLTCVEDALMKESVYYPVATDLYNNLTLQYPHAQIWLAGHSLGGGLASLLALTFGIPSVSFESPGDLLPARRLHLPLPPGLQWEDTGVVHVYNTADPIAMGTCNGAVSFCAVAGFALESRCHSGKAVVFDTVGKLGWSVDIRTHRINDVIDRLLIPDWDKSDPPTTPEPPPPSSSKKEVRSSWWGWGGGGKDKEDGGEGGDGNKGDDPEGGKKKKGGGVPEAKPEEDCADCFRWEFSDN